MCTIIQSEKSQGITHLKVEKYLPSYELPFLILNTAVILFSFLQHQRDAVRTSYIIWEEGCPK